MQTRTISRIFGLGGLLVFSSACGAESDPPSNKQSSGSGAAAGEAQGGNATAGTSSTAGANSAGGNSSSGSSSVGGSNGGGSSGASTGGMTGSEGCAPAADACTSAGALEKMALGDFENGQGWYLFANPDDADGTTEPAAGANIAAAEVTCPTGGLCGASSFAMHVTGGGFTSYGPSLSNDWVYESEMMVVGEPLDASEFTGVAFWARKGDTAGAAPTLRLIVNDVSTHAQGGVCDPMAATGSGGEPSEACWDGWMTERAVPSTWTLVKVPFSVLAQGGFGKPAEAIDASKIYGITFQMPNMADFDFWIDDVAFYKE